MTLENYLYEREELHGLLSKEMDQRLNKRHVCYDGAVHPELYLKGKFKIVWLLKEATKKWSMPIRNWGIILNQFLTIFEKRVQL